MCHTIHHPTIPWTFPQSPSCYLGWTQWDVYRHTYKTLLLRRLYILKGGNYNCLHWVSSQQCPWSPLPWCLLKCSNPSNLYNFSWKKKIPCPYIDEVPWAWLLCLSSSQGYINTTTTLFVLLRMLVHVHVSLKLKTILILHSKKFVFQILHVH